MSAAKPLTGVFPIAPTTFKEDGTLDLDSQRRALDCMIDQGVDGICILANYSEQFVLSDAERETLLDACAEHIAGRVALIVTTSHYSTDIAVARASRAEQAGADMLMVMPPYHGALLKADETRIFEHYARIADSVEVPLMVQDAPLSGVDLSVSFLGRMAREIPQVDFLKIEMPGTAAKLRALIEAAGEHIAGPFDGEESITLMADLDAGATGTMPSALLPEHIGAAVRAYLAGERDAARSLYARILPLINFENRQCGLRACKAVMEAGGVIGSDFVRHPQVALHPDTRTQLLELAAEQDLIALKWGR